MKRLKDTTLWTALACLGACLWVCGLTQADPSDDFSFWLAPHRGPAAARSAYDLLPATTIEQILRDRLTGYPTERAAELARHLRSLCELHRFDPSFVLALIGVESQFHADVHSSEGAVGLMQVMPATAREVLHEAPEVVPDREIDRQIRDPFVNLSVGLSYLATLRDRYHEMTPFNLVTAYNFGPARLSELTEEGHRPEGSRKYYEAIRHGLEEFRYYGDSVED